MKMSVGTAWGTQLIRIVSLCGTGLSSLAAMTMLSSRGITSSFTAPQAVTARGMSLKDNVRAMAAIRCRYPKVRQIDSISEAYRI
ncbi:hypothetical protein K7X08_037868 [Anisodus acutangulus]|uniref:Uncharacterized protein n=1 Tax=Anisodus acutangulus TaxID=402998 RepID=A0A9Q1RSF0_9SOLA|nr:hypothetical protein K7X08_037868 [Anisodus acutangulus]